MPRSATSAKKSRMDELEHANKQLRAENERLRSRLKRPRGSIWHNLIVSICVILAVLVLLAGNLCFWAGNTLINTDKYVATVQPLLAKKSVQVAVADYTTTQLFNKVDVEAAIIDVLPPKADFLAPQLTAQLRGATEKTLEKTLAGSRFQRLWTDTNRKAHERLVKAIKSSKTGDGKIDLQAVYDRLGQSLQGTKLGFLAGKTLPGKAGSVTVIDAPWLPKARFAVNNIGWLKPVSLILLAFFSAAAIWLARRKRRMVITLGSLSALGMLATLIAIQIVESRVAGHVQPAYHTAAHDAASIIFQPLVRQTLAVLSFSLLFVIIAWLTGPYRWAKCSVAATRQYLTTPLHRLIFSAENSSTEWVGANRQTLEWVIVALVGFIMLLVRLSVGLVILYGGLMLLLVLIVEFLAAPHYHDRR